MPRDSSKTEVAFSDADFQCKDQRAMSAREMETFLVRVLLIVAVVGSIVGCGQKEVPVTEVNNKLVPQIEETRHGGHDHHHHFADPAERAKKWNAADRDAWQRPEEIVAALGLTPGATVVDIGAGTGYMVGHLSRTVGKDGTVIAIDTSSEMVGYLVTRSNELGPARIVPRKVNPDNPELQIASVDGALMLDTWHHIHGQEAYAQKVHAGLKHGRRFAVVEYDVDSEVGPPKAMRLAPAKVTQQLEAAGFRVEVMRESMPRHYLVVGYKE